MTSSLHRDLKASLAITPADDGGPAYPREARSYQVGAAGGVEVKWDAGASGMSLRDYFAGQALAGLVAQSPVARPARDFASEAFMVADAMIAARKGGAS